MRWMKMFVVGSLLFAALGCSKEERSYGGGFTSPEECVEGYKTLDPDLREAEVAATCESEIEGRVPPEIAALIRSVEVQAGTMIIRTSIGPGEWEHIDGHNLCGTAKRSGFDASDIEVYAANGERIHCLP